MDLSQNFASIPEKLLKPYNPSIEESAMYALWEQSGYFNPDNLPDRHTEPYCIIMPPPNANGRLHAGHALDMTLKDVMIRYKRMQGYKALFLPGADHAGFETQIVYEKKLEKEGRSRFDLSREELYKEILAFTLESKQYMEADVKRLGTSCDWSREKFTLDPGIVQSVQQTFKKMFDDDLVYRGSRIVNWCSKHQTSLSDVETISKEQTDALYYLQYGPFVIATVRPETKFGDKYVVMHPEDERYKEYKHMQQLEIEWIDGMITATVIKDTAIDPEFGTGVMTITPWHSGIDFEIAQRHNLQYEQIIDFNGKLLPLAGEFAGQHIKKVRLLLIEKLKQKGLVVKIDEAYTHAVPVCYKCETVIEPQIRPQWFVKMDTLAQRALAPSLDGTLSFYPDNFKKIYEYWMNNTIDWNISRQIVWGIPIPAKLCTTCEWGAPDLDDLITTCPTCSSTLVQDTDTFDTWFSSGQWPLVTLGYPESTDFSTYYPTQLMETGRDLIFKWIPRMVLFGMYLANKVPFTDIYLHGMVNDEKNQKMSKSKGNVISPITLCDEYGADALRMALVVGTAPGNDQALLKDKIKGYKLFANKVWNIARFVLSNTLDTSTHDPLTPEDQTVYDTWKQQVKSITSRMDAYDLHIASETIYHYIWDTFASSIIEESKPLLASTDIHISNSRKKLLYTLLTETLSVLHPFMPFVTERIWQLLPHKERRLLMISPWPAQ